MMQFTTAQNTLLSILGDGACHSGSALGKALGITRSAIWKQINQLIDFGIPIKSIPQQGYQLPNPLILLNEQRISEHLQAKQLNSSFKMHLFTSVDSTNRFLKDLPPSNQLELCCAEVQTQGRGRFGRQWHSPFGENIYCSSRWNLNYDLSKLSGLSLITSLAILNTLNEFHLATDVKIKWPNDIYWADKKLCGSLIEILAESNGNAQVIIGIGLNVNTDTEKHSLPDKPWCSLYEMTQHYFDRNLLISGLIKNLERYLNKFIQTDLNAFMEEWNQSDYLAGKYIHITQAQGVLAGKACGINSMGQLILEDDFGIKHLLSSGDTTLQRRE
ncbi:biotin--[acetyl-CoA-carboxylase] ligase [Legionella rowbothamii]|uniref:biotin--[acetyl-CoA-carboxylase] ligase n=1 Tax=Legionella rowbothamii TaxID=96229 RepID=UPI001A93B0C3|nr:biotin--[acetyl-CoA-carboxylase] ligase [Legionella rowbothamii]